MTQNRLTVSVRTRLRGVWEYDSLMCLGGGTRHVFILNRSNTHVFWDRQVADYLEERTLAAPLTFGSK